MTVDEITNLVTKTAKDFDLGKHDTNNLVRYFIAKYCVWMTRESIAKLCGVAVGNLRRTIDLVQYDSRYAFIKLRIHDSIKKELNH